MTRQYGSGFPWGTWIINAMGSFVIGIAANWSSHPPVRFFLMVGLCGGFTTFSTFSLETVTFLKLGEWQKAGAYVLLSVLVCLAATFAGLWVARLRG